ncbi:MAG: lipid-A-disaccharide synthase [Verrucomicrobiota bacterium]|jgi:lipid-A-disaccharide synthase
MGFPKAWPFPAGTGRLTKETVNPTSILLVAGEPSGDQLAAELVRALRRRTGPISPRFFGIGGAAMADAGVEILCDPTAHSVIGPADALRQWGRFRQAFRRATEAARERTPDVVIGVDFGAFNLRLLKAITAMAQERQGVFRNWRPRRVQFVSPQVWASRPGRALEMPRILDRLLSILPFEKDWYARNAPGVRVEFVGHPLVDRHGPPPAPRSRGPGRRPHVVLLPGSRTGELRRHWPVVAPAARTIVERTGAHCTLVLPHEAARASLPPGVPEPEGLRVRIGGLAHALSEADVAIASTGTVTLECAWFAVPTVALYRTSWSTYQIGRRIIRVPHLAMPNLLAGKAVMPEFIQEAATPEALARAVLDLLETPGALEQAGEGLAGVRRLLGAPGAADRAAAAILTDETD